jgi:hypothetical protein
MNIALVRKIRIDVTSVNSSYGKIEVTTRDIQDNGGGNYTLINSDIITHYLSKKGSVRWVVNSNNTELAIYNGSRLIFNFSGEINSTGNEVIYEYADLVADLITVYPMPTSGGGGGSGIVETIIAGTNVTVDSSDPANPVVNGAVPYIQISQANAIDAENNQTIDPLTLGMMYAIDCNENSISYILLTRAIQDTSTGFYFFEKTCSAIVYAFGTATSSNSWCTVKVDSSFNMLTLSNAIMELNSTPSSLLQQMVAADNGINSFVNVYVGGNCDININILCQGWDGVRIGDNNSFTCQADSKLLNFSTDEGLTVSLPSSVVQTHNAWSGHVKLYDSNVDVILPTLGTGANTIDIDIYSTFGGNFHVTPDVAGNDIDNVSNGQPHRNYMINNIGTTALNFISGSNKMYCNSFLIGFPINLTNLQIANGVEDTISFTAIDDTNIKIVEAEVYN